MQHVPSHDFGVDIRLGRRPAFGGGCDVGLLLLVPVQCWPTSCRPSGRPRGGRGPQTSAFNVGVLDLQSTMDLQSISSINPVVS
jgi:hypothetical protein